MANKVNINKRETTKQSIIKKYVVLCKKNKEGVGFKELAKNTTLSSATGTIELAAGTTVSGGVNFANQAIQTAVLTLTSYFTVSVGGTLFYVAGSLSP